MLSQTGPPIEFDGWHFIKMKVKLRVIAPSVYPNKAWPSDFNTVFGTRTSALEYDEWHLHLSTNEAIISN